MNSADAKYEMYQDRTKKIWNKPLVKMAQIYHIPGKQKCPSRVAYEVQKGTCILLHERHVYVSALLLTGSIYNVLIALAFQG
jgi:hypothetical protein